MKKFAFLFPFLLAAAPQKTLPPKVVFHDVQVNAYMQLENFEEVNFQHFKEFLLGSMKCQVLSGSSPSPHHTYVSMIEVSCTTLDNAIIAVNAVCDRRVPGNKDSGYMLFMTPEGLTITIQTHCLTTDNVSGKNTWL